MKSRWTVRVWVALALVYALTCSAGAGWAHPEAPPSVLAPSLWVTPLSLDFGRVALGQTSAQQVVTVKNVGNATFSGFAEGAPELPFNATQDCTLGLPPGGSCQFTYTFSPTASGVFTDTTGPSSQAGSFNIELRGEGVGAVMHADSHYLDFGQVAVGDSSSMQAITVHNSGLTAMTNWAGGGVGAPYGSGQNCAPSLAPGDTCEFNYTFNPTQTGTFMGDTIVGTNGGVFSVDMWGRGWAGLRADYQQVTPRSLNFGPVGVGDSGEQLVVNVTNDSFAEVITGFAGGGVEAPFGSGQNCAPALAAGDTCQFSYTFSPTQAGVFTETSNVSTSRDSFSIALRGEAIEMLSITPLVLDFGYSDLGVAQTVTIVNTGDVAVTDFAGGGTGSPFSAGQNCAPSLAAGAACQWTYAYNPGVYGRHTANPQISTSAGSFSIQLIGGILAPTIEQVFLPDMIMPGGTAALQFSIHNPNAGASLFTTGFDNSFPQGMRVDDPPLDSTSPECGSAVFDPQPGDTSLMFSSATILPGKDCVVSLNVTADALGHYTNSSDQVHSQYSGPGDPASATLTVGSWTFLPHVVR